MIAEASVLLLLCCACYNAVSGYIYISFTEFLYIFNSQYSSCFKFTVLNLVSFGLCEVYVVMVLCETTVA